MGITRFIKSKPLLYKPLYACMYFFYNYVVCAKNDVESALRRVHLVPFSQYKGMKRFKDVHKGKRCFIVATGPSLTIADMESLKDEYTFAVNAVVKLYDRTNWRPTYFCIQDMNVYEELKSELHSEDYESLFLGNIAKHKHGMLKGAVLYHNHQLHHRIFNAKHYFTKFSGNAFATVYDGYTVVYSLMQIAAYMGFSEIYLLGCDCTMGKVKNDHVVQLNVKDPFLSSAQERLFAAYRTAKKYADTHEVTFYNATRGGELEIFERRKLEDILAGKYSE